MLMILEFVCVECFVYVEFKSLMLLFDGEDVVFYDVIYGVYF